jgi:hypothetical protein
MLMWKLQGYMALEEEQAALDGQRDGDDRYRQNDRHGKSHEQGLE